MSSWHLLADTALSTCPASFLPTLQTLIDSFTAHESNLVHKRARLSSVVSSVSLSHQLSFFPPSPVLFSCTNLTLTVPKLIVRNLRVFSTHIELEGNVRNRVNQSNESNESNGINPSNRVTVTNQIMIDVNFVKRILILPLDYGRFGVAICLSKKIYFGKNGIDYVVFGLKAKEVMTSVFIEGNMKNCKEEVKKKLGKIAASSLAVENVAKIFSAVSGVQIEQPKMNAKKESGVACRIKTNNGFLFLFSSGIFYFPAPCVFVAVEDIAALKLGNSGNRFCDFTVKSTKMEKEITFGTLIVFSFVECRRNRQDTLGLY